MPLNIYRFEYTKGGPTWETSVEAPNFLDALKIVGQKFEGETVYFKACNGVDISGPVSEDDIAEIERRADT